MTFWKSSGIKEPSETCPEEKREGSRNIQRRVLLGVYLEHKHFSSEDADGVKMAIADVGAKVRLVGGVGGLGVVLRCVWRQRRGWKV